MPVCCFMAVSGLLWRKGNVLLGRNFEEHWKGVKGTREAGGRPEPQAQKQTENWLEWVRVGTQLSAL